MPRDTRDDIEPREALGDPLWELLGRAEEHEVPPTLDAGFRSKLEAPRARRRWVVLGAAAVMLAASALLALRPSPPPGDDLELIAELELVENLDLLQDLDVLLAWDGEAP